LDLIWIERNTLPLTSELDITFTNLDSIDALFPQGDAFLENLLLIDRDVLILVLQLFEDLGFVVLRSLLRLITSEDIASAVNADA
jgi:hypothetical protein